MKLVNENNSFDTVSKKVIDLFYEEIKAKVLNEEL
jgi:hypothetical protein